MILVRFFRLLFGYARFSAVGGFPDRFFSLCREKNISLSDIVYTEGGFTAMVFGKNIGRIRECAQQAGMQLDIIRKKGLPYLLFRYRLRVGIPVGIIISFVLFSVWSSIIWSVSVSGCEKIPESELLGFFEENGIKRGVFRKSIDCDGCEDAVMSAYPSLSWVSVNIKGCRAEIELTERREAPEIFDKNTYVNIIASRDGEILRADVLAGKGNIIVGLPVLKGDLLVSGVVTMKDERVRFVHSQASIIARTQHETRVTQKTSYTCGTAENEKDIFSLYIFGLKVPLGYMKDYGSSYECEYILNAGNTLFPLSAVRKRCTVTGETEVELTENRAMLMCAAKYPLSERKELGEAEKETRTIETEISGSEISWLGSCYCHEDIAVEQVFEVETSQ